MHGANSKKQNSFEAPSRGGELSQARLGLFAPSNVPAGASFERFTMPWIESHSTLRAHKKLKPFCDDLKITRAAGIGHLHMLWWWTLDNRDNGDLSGLFDRDIAVACDWTNDPKLLIKALKKHGWLHDNGQIHDWSHYAGRLLQDRERKRLRRVLGQSSDVSSATVPNRTVPNSIKGLLLKTQEKQLKKLLSDRLGVGVESESLELEYKNMIEAIEKDNEIKEPVKIAFYRAKNGFKQ